MISITYFFSSIKLTPLDGEFPGVEGQIWVDSEQHVESVHRSTSYIGLTIGSEINRKSFGQSEAPPSSSITLRYLGHREFIFGECYMK